MPGAEMSEKDRPSAESEQGIIVGLAYQSDNVGGVPSTPPTRSPPKGLSRFVSCDRVLVSSAFIASICILSGKSGKPGPG